MKNFIPFAAPDIGEEEIAEVVATMKSGWLTTGPKVKEFESDFAGFIGGDIEAVAVNSATAGLHLTLEAIGLGAGDQVITTPYTFTATAEVVRYLDADPVFVDIDPATLNIDHSMIEAAITPKTKAIIPVHFAGLACNMKEILNIANKHGIRVIEDAAHALPATTNGRLIGSLDSNAAVFSFYATKTITTGEGGMIVTKDKDIAKRCRTMRLHGISRDVFDRYTSRKSSWYYEVVAPGFKYNMTDVAAAIGIQQLKKAWSFQKRRSEMAENYNKALADLPLTLPPLALAGDYHSWHLYTIRLHPEAGISRDKFIEAMSERGIGLSVHFIPLHLQPYWRDKYNLKPADYNCSTSVYENVVSLPLYTKMTNEDQERVITSIREILS